MKSFNWEALITPHPTLSDLSLKEITQLLGDQNSQERVYPPGSEILREGEHGDSVFLIGSGSVQVVLRGGEGQEIPLSVLHQGELFGEMAVLERKPRSATVVARETCTLLEITGQAFLALLKEHTDIHAKILAQMHRRLAQASQR